MTTSSYCKSSQYAASPRQSYSPTCAEGCKCSASTGQHSTAYTKINQKKKCAGFRFPPLSGIYVHKYTPTHKIKKCVRPLLSMHVACNIVTWEVFQAFYFICPVEIECCRVHAFLWSICWDLGEEDITIYIYIYNWGTCHRCRSLLGQWIRCLCLGFSSVFGRDAHEATAAKRQCWLLFIYSVTMYHSYSWFNMIIYDPGWNLWNLLILMRNNFNKE